MKTRGRYVYAWLDGDVPFYVGKGEGKRAWQRHTLSDGKFPAFCERLKHGAADFRVVIVRDNLTAEGALVCEDAVRRAFEACYGLLPGNQAGTLKRQDKPPLELYEGGDNG